MTGSGDRRLPLGRLARVGAAEVGSVLRAGWHTLVRPPLPAPVVAPHLPATLVVHGFLARGATLHPLARALVDGGVPEVVVVDYPSTWVRFEEIVDRIAVAAVALERRHGPVGIVGHSLGAVAARSWIKRFGGAPHVARFVSIAGPHHGTALHRLLAPRLRGVLDPHGPVLRAANEGPEPVPTTVVRARHDLQVVPAESASLPDVPEHVFDHLGHNALLTAPDVHEVVLRALRTDR